MFTDKRINYNFKIIEDTTFILAEIKIRMLKSNKKGQIPSCPSETPYLNSAHGNIGSFNLTEEGAPIERVLRLLKCSSQGQMEIT